MSLIKKILGKDNAGGPQSTQYQDSEYDGPASRNAPRRELVQVVLRDTMRQHAIPNDWIDSRVLSVVNANGSEGLHVQLIVRRGHDRLLPYVPAFQGSFMSGIASFEPRASDWLLSLSWEFLGIHTMAAMPGPSAWASAPAPLAESGAAPMAAAAAASTEADELAQDLKALFAIRDAAINTDKPL